MLIFYLFGAVTVVIMFITFARSGHFFKNALESAFTGLVGLGLSWGASLFGLSLINLNLATALTAIVLGLPGVIGLMLAKVILM